MPEFVYQGRNQQGLLVTGKRAGNSPETVATQLSSEGVIPVTIELAPAPGPTFRSFLLKLGIGKVSTEELIFFCRQMYSLYKAGIPLATATIRLAETANNPMLGEALRKIADHISSGQSMATAMQNYPYIFPDLIIKLIKIGEASARVDEAFDTAADYLELENKTLAQVKTVLRYPTFVILAIAIAMVIINIFVIPVFAKLFLRFEAKLPLPTVILINTSQFMHDYWYLLLGGLLSIIIGIRVYLKTTTGKLTWGKLQLHLPVIGNVILLIILARFAKSFSIVLRSGVSLPEGIALVAGAANNLYASRCILSMQENIERGTSLTNAAASTHLFSPLVIQMLAVGEETGNLDSMLTQVSNFYERSVDQSIKKMSALIEPILLLAVAIMVLTLALGVFLPMWSMTQFVH